MSQVKPIPQGYHTIIPHLVVRGGAAAIDFYKKAFGALEHGRMPMPDGKIMHAQLKIGDSYLFLCDEFAEQEGWKAGQAWRPRDHPPERRGRRRRVPAGGGRRGHSEDAVTDMFWGDRYGKLVDPFGHEWSLSTHKEDVSPEEMKKRGQEMMAQMGKH